MPKARRSGLMASPVSAMITPAGAMPIRPNARLTATPVPFTASRASETIAPIMQTVRIRFGLLVRSETWPQAAPEKIMSQLPMLMTAAASTAP